MFGILELDGEGRGYSYGNNPAPGAELGLSPWVVCVLLAVLST